MATLFLAAAAALPAQVLSSRSSSGQFVCSSRTFAPTPRRILSIANTNSGLLRLSPTLLSVSAERIKQVICRELDFAGPWQRKIFLSIKTAHSTNDPVLLASDRFTDGWNYGLEFPEVVDRVRYVRAVTQGVLLEMANRNARDRAAEIPSWIIEGLVQHLLTSYSTEILLAQPLPGTSIGGSTVPASAINVQRENPLKKAREYLMFEPGLSFSQMSWPKDEQLQGPDSIRYRYCAQVFLHELASLPGGRQALREMVFNLSQFYNWQFAFIKAFHPRFQRPLDIEKWWTLQLAHFAGRDLAETWDIDESWVHLDETLGASAHIRATTNDLPQQVRVTLQVIVRDWKPADQTRILQEKIVQLQMLRLRAAPELTTMIDGYREAIQNYLEKRARLNADTYARNNLSQRRLALATIQDLDLLDARRDALRPRRSPPA